MQNQSLGNTNSSQRITYQLKDKPKYLEFRMLLSHFAISVSPIKTAEFILHYDGKLWDD